MKKLLYLEYFFTMAFWNTTDASITVLIAVINLFRLNFVQKLYFYTWTGEHKWVTYSITLVARRDFDERGEIVKIVSLLKIHKRTIIHCRHLFVNRRKYINTDRILLAFFRWALLSSAHLRRNQKILTLHCQSNEIVLNDNNASLKFLRIFAVKYSKSINLYYLYIYRV